LVDTQSVPTDIQVEVSVDGQSFAPCTPYPNEMHSGVYALASSPTTAAARHRVEPAIAGLDAQADCAIIVDLPLPKGRWGLSLASNARVVLRADDFIRASEYPSDELFAQAAGADMLPLTLGRETPVLERTSTFLDVPRDPDGDLTTDGDAHRVRVVLDVPGVVQAFVQ
jgi:hypothetical protein